MGKIKRIKTHYPHSKNTHTPKYVEFKKFKNSQNFPKL
jgi:hypothetical protein